MKEKIRKKAKVIDMMVTMHSILANRYLSRLKIVELCMFAVSIIIVSCTFLDPALVAFFNIDPELVRVIVGFSSILMFFMSITLLVVDWKGEALKHREGFSTLTRLKNEFRDILSDPENFDDKMGKDFLNKSSLITGQTTSISDKHFLKLKAVHKQKIELSKMISNNPGCSLYLLKLKMFYQNIVKLLLDRE